MALDRRTRVKVGQVWASNHLQDRERGSRQERVVVAVDHRWAYLSTDGRKPTRVQLRVRGTASSIVGYRLVKENTSE